MWERGTRICFRNAKYFQSRSAKQEREAKFGTRERGNANLRTREINIYTGARERGNAKAKSRNAGTRDAKALRNARPSLVFRLITPRGFATQLALFVEVEAIFALGWVITGMYTQLALFVEVQAIFAVG